jgi:hypothetical protein
MGEMTHYKKAAEKFGDVDFLFLCVKSDPADWEKEKAKYDLPGRHFLPTNNQLAFFEEKLGIRGYPSHLIIQDGLVVFENSPAKGPTRELLDAILREIHP